MEGRAGEEGLEGGSEGGRRWQRRQLRARPRLPGARQGRGGAARPQPAPRKGSGSRAGTSCGLDTPGGAAPVGVAGDSRKPSRGKQRGRV